MSEVNFKSGYHSAFQKKKKVSFDERWWWCLALWPYFICKLNWCKTGRHAYTLIAVYWPYLHTHVLCHSILLTCTRRNCNKVFFFYLGDKFTHQCFVCFIPKTFFFKIYLLRCSYVKALSFGWPDRNSPEWEDGRAKTGNVQEKC